MAFLFFRHVLWITGSKTTTMKLKAIVTVALIAAGLTMTTAMTADAQGMHQKMKRHHRHMQNGVVHRYDGLRSNHMDGRRNDHRFRSNSINRGDHRMQGQSRFNDRRNGQVNDMRNGRMQDHGGYDRRKDGSSTDRTRNNGQYKDRRNDQTTDRKDYNRK